jgi:hypothetical protein
MAYARFTTQKGGHEFSGPATVKAKTIEVESSAFGKLIFDRATGKAKGGTAQIQNLGEVLESAPPAEVGPVTKKIEWMIVSDYQRYSRDNKEFRAVMSIVVTKDNARFLVGIVETIEPVYGTPEYTVGQTVEFTRERYGRGVPERYETRDKVIEKLAIELVDDAESYLKDADKWALKFGPKELGFVPEKAIRAAIGSREDDDKGTGYSRRSYRRITLDDDDDKRDKKYEVVTKENLVALLIEGKRPQMKMV